MNKKLVLAIALLVLGGVSYPAEMVSLSSSVQFTFRRPISRLLPSKLPVITSTSQLIGQVAITSIDQEFYNPNDQRLEGFYMFPVPKGAHFDKFSMEIGGKSVDAELLPADKARRIYEDIVRKVRDPALSVTPAATYLRSASFRSNRAAASPSRFPIRNCFAPMPDGHLSLPAQHREILCSADQESEHEN